MQFVYIVECIVCVESIVYSMCTCCSFKELTERKEKRCTAAWQITSSVCGERTQKNLAISFVTLLSNGILSGPSLSTPIAEIIPDPGNDLSVTGLILAPNMGFHQTQSFFLHPAHGQSSTPFFSWRSSGIHWLFVCTASPLDRPSRSSSVGCSEDYRRSAGTARCKH